MLLFWIRNKERTVRLGSKGFHTMGCSFTQQSSSGTIRRHSGRPIPSQKVNTMPDHAHEEPLARIAAGGGGLTTPSRPWCPLLRQKSYTSSFDQHRLCGQTVHISKRSFGCMPCLPKSPYFIGNLSFFALKSHHGAPNAPAAGKRDFDVTNVVSMLRREHKWNSSEMSLTFVPTTGLLDKQGRPVPVEPGKKASLGVITLSLE